MPPGPHHPRDIGEALDSAISAQTQCRQHMRGTDSRVAASRPNFVTYDFRDGKSRPNVAARARRTLPALAQGPAGQQSQSEIKTMDAVFRVADRLFDAVSAFGPHEWAVVSILTVVVGYMCLKGMNIR